MSQQLEFTQTLGTQKQRVLTLLRARGPAGLCLADLPIDLGYTVRNRIAELRAQGYTITTATCRVHAHHGTVARYVLRGGPR